MDEIPRLYELISSTLPNVTTDSRSVTPGCLFVGLKGENYNGNLFAAEALSKGAAFAIVDDPSAAVDDRIFLVGDSLRTLQLLALHHRGQITAKIIAITGSNGKTTTKELVGKALASKFNTQMTVGNLNNHIGVPLTILSLSATTDFAVVEMGANHPGEIGALCEIARPDYGLITNIGKAHLEGFGSLEGVARAKSELYRFLKKNNGQVFLNIDNPVLANLAAGISQITYGKIPAAICQGEILQTDPMLSLRWRFHDKNGAVYTQLSGDYNFENVLASICIGLHFGAEPGPLSSALEEYLPSNNRSQWVDTGNNKLLLDAYNANPSSMKAALTSFSRLNAPNRIVILGDMMELGEYAAEGHSEVANLALNAGFEDVIFIGEAFYSLAGKNAGHSFITLEQATDWLKENPMRHAAILLKGSRKMQLEKLIPYL